MFVDCIFHLISQDYCLRVKQIQTTLKYWGVLMTPRDKPRKGNLNLTFELLIATMHKSIAEVKRMLLDMNIHCNCLVVNQCDKEDYYEENSNRRLRIFFTRERGLSKSRNMALQNAEADVVAIGDDDLYYYDGFDKKILDYYSSNSNADVVLFNMDDCYKTFSSKSSKCSFVALSGFKSVQTTLKLESMRNKKVVFNELFGTGSGYFNSGEENIFLADCYKKRLRIFYCKDKILRRDETESSWFTSFNDELFIRTRGAVYYAMSKFIFLPYIVRFAVKYRNKLKPNSILSSLSLMYKGKKDFLVLMKKTELRCNHKQI